MTLIRKHLDFDAWFKLVSLVSNMRDNLIFSVLYSTGCSELELTSIKISDINFKNNVISFQNATDKRNSKINSKLSSELQSYIKSNKIASNSFLFQGQNSIKLSEKRIQQIVIFYSENILGKKIIPKQIRYTHIAHALIRGISVFSIASQSGLKLQRIMQISQELDLDKEMIRGYEL